MNLNLNTHCQGLPAKIAWVWGLWWLLAGAVWSLDSTEKSIADAVVAGQAKALELLETSVNINSGTMNFAGVKATGELFQQQFADLGFDTQWIDGTPFERAGHLVASHGTKGPKILLIGHLDTVFPIDSPFQQYELLPDNRARGPGITDMKGGNVVMLLALQSLLQNGVLDQLQVRVVLAGDEERRGKPYSLANAALIEAAQWADVALGFEDGDSDPRTAVIARRSAGSWTLTIAAGSGHSSQIFREDVGNGAIFEAARILDGWREALSDEPNLTFNPGLILGGTAVERDGVRAMGSAAGKDNVIAGHATVSGGIRALSQLQLDAAIATMQEIASESGPNAQASFEFFPAYPPMAPTDGNRRLLAMFDNASRDLGHGSVTAVDPRRAGAADISFAAEYVDMALDGLGLMGEGGHTVDEIADLSTLVSQTQRAAVVLYRLSQQQ